MFLRRLVRINEQYPRADKFTQVHICPGGLGDFGNVDENPLETENSLIGNNEMSDSIMNGHLVM